MAFDVSFKYFEISSDMATTLIPAYDYIVQLYY